jgi:hypothetical protein
MSATNASASFSQPSSPNSKQSPQGASMLASGSESPCSTSNTQSELSSSEVAALRAFFALLDEWDQRTREGLAL